ncbi:hemerythrin domain-containing protein [Geothrix sp. PMB-07]|uniref:hemerythrin domain-containing protein n=1 Tax=Geothrix sp. PMB-07 TaxID=3068640 RepID=UPI0027418AC0|nr:hemerythrin domain-containing protein [Geothrix sp. PMB-07]WLT32498.1 hemerythrin domain-containing protein [Geothrix sp. PMB-07]
MQLIEDLRAEHELIERVAESLRAFVTARMANQGDPADGGRFLAFFRHYVGTFHHHKEEAVFFQALTEKAEVPGHRGPVAALTLEHASMGRLLDELGPLLGEPALDADSGRHLHDLAVEYSRSLWRHIDAENSVIFPEGQERLRRFHVRELPSRPMTDPEQAAHDGGLALLAAYPPERDAEVHRGDGCVTCPSYGIACEGLEREWWTDLEWEDMHERMSGD